MFTVHDDWGTERDAFFSPEMMEELLFEPTKRIIDHVHSLGKLYQFHCCGKVDKFLPAFCALGPDFMQLQRRVNDIPAYKAQYGAQLGFHTGVEGLAPGKRYEEEELRSLIRQSVELFAPGGGFLPAVYGLSPEALWNACAELYCYGREYYAAG
jgi:uroporphyrinogen-III decarboxylase